jgi:uncharacterized protein YcbX
MMRRKSALLRDISFAMSQYAEQLDEAALPTLAQQLRNYAELLRVSANIAARGEPPLPSIESLAGSIQNLTGGLSPEEYLRQLRAGEF